MIKNVGPLFLPLAALLAAGCRRAPATPPGFQGVVELDERVVSFEVPGRITSVAVKRGDAVAPGALLATLDDGLEKLARDGRVADVDVAKSDLALLEAGTRKEDIASLAAQVKAARAAEDVLIKNEERTRSLVEKGSLAQAELDRVEADRKRATGERQSLEARLTAMIHGARKEDVARAKARVAAASTAVSLEDERLARFQVKSLTAGVVIDVHVEPGELAAPGTPAATIADVAHPYVDVFVPQQELDGVRLGARASIRVDATSQPFPGHVEWVSPRTEFTPRFLFSDRERPNLVVRVRVRVDDPAGRLHSGVPAFVVVERAS